MDISKNKRRFTDTFSRRTEDEKGIWVCSRIHKGATLGSADESAA